MPLLTRLLHPRAVAAALLLSLAACGEDRVTLAPRPAVASIRVTPGTPSLLVGQSLTLAAVPLAADGSTLQDRPVTWTSQDPTRATVSAVGVVHALAAGTVTITARSEGVSSDLDVDIDIIPAASIDFDVLPLGMYEGSARFAHAVAYDAQGRELADRTIAWTSSAPGVASVTDAGFVTAHREGEAEITAALDGISASFTVSVRTQFVADLMFDTYTGLESGPRLFRAGPYDAVATPIFFSAGTWQATASPDGSRIAFTCTNDPRESPTICVANRDGSNVRVLTSGDGMLEDEPAWSPDGQRIAFRRWAQGAPPGLVNPTDIWVMNVNGSGQVNLTDDALVQRSPAWSPQPISGEYRLAFSQETRSATGYLVSRILTVRADGTDREPFTAGGEVVEGEPSWSPDGRQIVFTRSGGEYDGELIVRGVFSGEERLLLGARLPHEQRSPVWSPDGRHIAFLSAHEDSPNGNIRRQVYTVRADGTGLRRRTTSDADKDHVTWLPRP